jgi:integral membrane protein
VRKRQATIGRDLPDFLDVLAITVRSGMSFRSSLERVCNHFDGPIAEEMRKALHEMRLGVSRRDAFTALKERCRSGNIDNFVAALLQSEELGTPIGEALTSIVKEIRRERAQQVRRAAAKAQPKVSLVATTTMVPGTMILMLGGMVYANRDMFSRLFGG